MLPGAAGSHAPLQTALARAEQHLRAGRERQAEDAYRSITRTLPKHLLANRRLGAICLRQRRLADALKCLEQVVSHPSAGLPDRVRLVATLQCAGAMDSAAELLGQINAPGVAQAVEQMAASLSMPLEAQQRHLLGLYRRGDALTAEIAARLFIQDYPGHPLGWQILGALLHDQGRLEEALQVKLQTTDEFPQDVNAWNNLAATQMAMERFDEALASARRALVIDPGHASARAHEAMAVRSCSDSA